MFQPSSIIKYHKLISFGISLGFLIVVQRFATPVPVFRFLIPAFLILAGLASYYNRWYLKQINKYNFWRMLRPLLILLSAFGLFSIFPSESIRGVFLISAIFFITFSEILIGVNSENLVLVETLLTAFGQFFTLCALYIYAPTYGFYYVFAVFALSALLSRAYYDLIPQSANIKFITSLVIGLFCAEIFWALNFLPGYFSATAFLLFSIFYFCITINYYHFFQTLSFKKIQFHLLLIVFSSALVLISAPWSIIQ
jgi:hypothetical protein